MIYIGIISLIIAFIFIVYKINKAMNEKSKGNTLNAIYELIWVLIAFVIISN